MRDGRGDRRALPHVVGPRRVTRLSDIARVVRSKNAGPTLLTLDVIFRDEEGYRRGLAALRAETIGALYDRAPSDVTVIPYPPALAIKVVLPRGIVAGAPGDRDVYGAQQHGPLLGIAI